ncbi:MAG TPA: SUMF1/EgtB/PvdO family nonheme iron enzyme [Bacteroidales bacterium]|nr:SUMF1/EgtB/PvdO family nonheme iron enzyme [Bacteroidales bacterium]
MKTILYFCFIIISFNIYGHKEKQFVPPGTVKLNESLYVDKTEVSNISYKEYIYWNKKFKGENSPEYLFCLPDTTVWEEPLRSIYLWHPAYEEYPVVGISYEQAVDYCKWRSDRVNELFYLKENKLSKNTDLSNVDIPQKVIFRLPTKAEWQIIAVVNYSKKSINKLNSKKSGSRARCNFAGNNIEDINSDKCQITCPVKSYVPNLLGIYCIDGNVAEMIDEKGIAKGGSWKHKEEEYNVDKDYCYTKPEVWLGFRCVCEVL